MDKIVVVFHAPADWGDPYENTCCFIYSSPEQWLIDFETLLKEFFERKMKSWDEESSYFSFCEREFCIHDFCNVPKGKLEYKLPDVYSLKEWFEMKLKE